LLAEQVNESFQRHRFKDASTRVVVLRDVLGRIADHRINRIAELLPWNVANCSPTRVAA
jgi:hypothetical protein